MLNAPKLPLYSIVFLMGILNNPNILVVVVFVHFSFKNHNCEYQMPALLVPAFLFLYLNVTFECGFDGLLLFDSHSFRNICESCF